MLRIALCSVAGIRFRRVGGDAGRIFAYLLLSACGLKAEAGLTELQGFRT